DASARDLLSQHDGTARIEADQVKGVLAHIYSDGGHCVKSGRAGHGGAPFLTSPRRTLKTVGGGSAAGPSHYRTLWRYSRGVNETLFARMLAMVAPAGPGRLCENHAVSGVLRPCVA